jgi:putative tryptophan/tyrosine transport system substrate-binding protein
MMGGGILGGTPMPGMRRREFVTLLGGAAIYGPAAAQGQQPERMPLIGVLSGTTENDPEARRRVASFTRALRELGWNESRNIKLEKRYSAGRPERLPALAIELVDANSAVIVAEAAQAVDAARAATRTIPIVMVYVGDALGPGYVASLARPGGNITGQTLVATDQAAKRLELMRKLSPDIRNIAVLSNLNASGHVLQRKEMSLVAPTLDIVLQQLPMQSRNELDASLRAAVDGKAQAIITMEDPMVESARAEITAFALKHRLPVMGEFKPMTEAGGLMSYGPNQIAMWGRSAFYVDKILRGANPANLPVEQPAKFELTINLRTAKTLDLELPPTLLALADQVIE